MQGRGEPGVGSASRVWAALRAISPETGLLPSKLFFCAGNRCQASFFGVGADQR